MAEIRFRDLTEEQKKFICNGCGDKGAWIKPPQFFFEADCNHHDFNYWLGCTEADRKKADIQFYEAMKRDVALHSIHKRVFYYFAAWIYFKAVRIFGYKFFYFGPKMRTKEDLEEAIKKA